MLVKRNEKLPLPVVFQLLSTSEYAGKTFDPPRNFQQEGSMSYMCQI